MLSTLNPLRYSLAQMKVALLQLVSIAVLLIGLFVFPQLFWLWFAIFCGGPVLLSGFVVRFAWR